MLKGERLDRSTYSFLHTLNEGNSAVCYLTQHEIFGCQVVQKTVSMLGLGDSAAAKEPEILKRIRHPHVVEVWEAQWDPAAEWKAVNGVTFTTPYYEGQSIHTALLSKHVFGVRETIRIGTQLLDALDHLHVSHHLLHRDVKPANVMLSATRNDAYLGDLGSAAYIDAAAGGADAGAGSPLYCAPEGGARGRLTAQSDLYSLGMTLMEMLNGRFPYETLDPTDIEQRLRVGQRSLPDRYFDPSPWVPKPLATFLRSLTNKDPEKRHSSAASAGRALSSIRVVDWKRSEGAGLTGVWVGTWPPDLARNERRIYEVQIKPIERGQGKGCLKASARWRTGGRGWRNYRRLTETLSPISSEVAKYFRKVESAAQAAPIA